MLIELLAFVLHQVEVVRDHHDRVARCDAGQRDEANQGRDRHLPHHEIGEHQRADERQGNVEQNLRDDHARTEMSIEKQENHAKGEDRENRDDARGLLLALKLSLITDEVARFEVQFFPEGLLDIGHDGPEVAAGHIGRNGNAALHVLTLDLVRTLALPHVGHQVEWHFAPDRGVDENVADGGRIDAGKFIEADHEIIGALSFKNIGHHAAIERRFEQFV